MYHTRMFVNFGHLYITKVWFFAVIPTWYTLFYYFKYKINDNISWVNTKITDSFYNTWYMILNTILHSFSLFWLLKIMCKYPKCVKNFLDKNHTKESCSNLEYKRINECLHEQLSMSLFFQGGGRFAKCFVWKSSFTNLMPSSSI